MAAYRAPVRAAAVSRIRSSAVRGSGPLPTHRITSSSLGTRSRDSAEGPGRDGGGPGDGSAVMI
ncbi:hypothetical protein GCM10018772_13250 [Streptomyces fumanus]|uniref:Uncharacterized protein n=1 Tax=Streptomyces fumanus TaxID=67302 RepID=A0A919A7V7_9ACTN|nr:hypothetical protein GCM10018772_13250 [Streptomyces fumanus]